MPELFRLIEDEATFVHAADFFDHVAFVAHNCYQVKAKDHDSNVAFVRRLIESGHLAMIEHYRFLFEVDASCYEALLPLRDPYVGLYEAEGRLFASLSLRPILESDPGAPYGALVRALPEDVRALAPVRPSFGRAGIVDPFGDGYPPSIRRKVLYPTYEIVTDRGVTHELVRHRPCSFAQESTRYCNYSKEKFGSVLTFLKPLRYDEMKDLYDPFFESVAKTYFALLSRGAKPQEARSVLPNALKTDIMVTASLEEWGHIFALRLSERAHPDIRHVMSKVRDDMVKRKFLQVE